MSSTALLHLRYAMVMVFLPSLDDLIEKPKSMPLENGHSPQRFSFGAFVKGWDSRRGRWAPGPNSGSSLRRLRSRKVVSQTRFAHPHCICGVFLAGRGQVPRETGVLCEGGAADFSEGHDHFRDSDPFPDLHHVWDQLWSLVGGLPNCPSQRTD